MITFSSNESLVGQRGRPHIINIITAFRRAVTILLGTGSAEGRTFSSFPIVSSASVSTANDPLVVHLPVPPSSAFSSSSSPTKKGGAKKGVTFDSNLPK